MVRTQISLTEDQMAALREVADQRGVPIAMVVRAAVDAEVAAQARLHSLQHALAAVTALGRGSAAAESDVARDHDRHLADAFGA